MQAKIILSIWTIKVNTNKRIAKVPEFSGIVKIFEQNEFARRQMRKVCGIKRNSLLWVWDHWSDDLDAPREKEKENSRDQFDQRVQNGPILELQNNFVCLNSVHSVYIWMTR